ncbi:MAG: single-stranded-DNA-specific exonuclease RecJ [Chitinophagaceae bacterium]
MKKRWKLLAPDSGNVLDLQDELKVSSLICTLLVNRGLTDFETCRSFFQPELSSLHSPWLMKDMQLAVARILVAFEGAEKILVYGDYDVDGTSSVAILYNFIREQYHPDKVDFYLPHRYREGYGISRIGIDYAIANNFSLVISLDCGIKSADLISYAKVSGIDFIICDHHLPDDVLPQAVAILNPKQPGCLYPFKDLCGCGITFKLITALAEKLNVGYAAIYPLLDLVATAIAADIVPMTGENRILAWHGLKLINENPCPGINAILELSGLKKMTGLTITNVVFIIAPRVNAAGRMDDARKAVWLFIEKDMAKAREYAAMLQVDNINRKETDSNITEEALEMVKADQMHPGRKTTVVYQPHWHKGVVGIVASRLIETHYRPTIVLTHSGDLLSGSARSVSGFNLYEAIHACRSHLFAYGGHFAAAGLSLHPNNLDSFIGKFEEVVGETILPEMLIPQIIIDAEILFTDIDQRLLRTISRMEPFGPGNLHPVFITRNVVDNGWSRIVKEKHISFNIRHSHIVFRGIGFGLAEKFAFVNSGALFDIVYTIEENEWNNEKCLQLKVIDLQPSES